MFEIILNHRITGSKEYKAFAEMRYSMTVAMIEGICIVCYEAICCKNFLDIFMKKKKESGVFPMSVLSIAFMFVLLIFSRMNSGVEGCLLFSLGIVIANILEFMLLKYAIVKEKEGKQTQMLQELNKQGNLNDEFTKRMLHDYGNQLNCILGLLQQQRYNQVQEYVKKLTTNFQEGHNVVEVHHPVINVLLNQKYHLAEERGIAMIFQLNNLSLVWMEEPDLVVLLSNLLDNAIEACEKCKEKVIWVKIILEKKEMVISIKNPVEQGVEIQNKLIHTTKENAEKHGIGLKNIRFVLEKYNAMGTMMCKDGYFWYTAVIPKNKVR